MERPDHREHQFIFARRSTAVRSRLRRNRDDAGAELLEFRKGSLERLKFHVTIGAPRTTIEADDERAFCKELMRGDNGGLGALEGEGGRLVADLFRALGGARCPELGGRTMHGLDYRVWN